MISMTLPFVSVEYRVVPVTPVIVVYVTVTGEVVVGTSTIIVSYPSVPLTVDVRLTVPEVMDIVVYDSGLFTRTVITLSTPVVVLV